MNSSNIIVGPGYATWNAGNFRFGDGGIKAKFVKNLREISAEEFGRFDSVTTKRRVTVSGKLWSGWENLSLILPGVALNPAIGSKLFGVTALPLVVNGQDGSRLTVVHAQLTKLANLTLSVEKELWSADVEWTGLLLPGNTPDQANGYYTYSIGNAYAAPAFDKTKFRAPVISANKMLRATIISSPTAGQPRSPSSVLMSPSWATPSLTTALLREAIEIARGYGGYIREIYGAPAPALQVPTSATTGEDASR